MRRAKLQQIEPRDAVDEAADMLFGPSKGQAPQARAAHAQPRDVVDQAASLLFGEPSGHQICNSASRAMRRADEDQAAGFRFVRPRDLEESRLQSSKNRAPRARDAVDEAAEALWPSKAPRASTRGQPRDVVDQAADLLYGARRPAPDYVSDRQEPEQPRAEPPPSQPTPIEQMRKMIAQLRSGRIDDA
jgi:hypothetical protein